MATDDADELVAFRNVRVVRSTPPALFCAIGDKRVWLPRRHISGRLWSRGDCGDLLIRRWVALDRHLMDPFEPSISGPSRPGPLRLLRRPPETLLGH